MRVVASPTIADWWLPAALVALEGRHERHLSVEVITANSSLVRDMVRNGRCDIGLAAVDPGEHDAASDRDGRVERRGGRRRPEGPITGQSGATSIRRVRGHADHPPRPRRQLDPGRRGSARVRGPRPVTPLAEIGNNVAARATALAENAPVLLPFAELMDEADGGLVVKRVAGLRFEREFALILGVSLQDLAAPARALAQHLLGWQRG